MNSECEVACKIEPTGVEQRLNNNTMTCRRSRRPTATATAMLLVAALALVTPHSLVTAATDGSSDADTSTDNDATASTKTTFRVFQTLPAEPSQMTPNELSQMHRTIRATQAMIFAPSHKHYSTSASTTKSLQDDNVELALDIYTPAERREYLVKRGNHCHPRSNGGGPTATGNSNALNDHDEDTSSLQWYDVLSRYDSLMAGSGSASDKESTTEEEEVGKKKNAEVTTSSSSDELERTAIELFKYCVLYNGDGHAFWGWEEQLLLPFRDVVNVNDNFGVVNVATMNSVDKTDSSTSSAAGYIHESFLSISPYTPATSELSAMIRLLLETSDELLASSPLLLPRELHRLISAKKESNTGSATATNDGGSVNEDGNVESSDGGEKSNNGASWTLLSNTCIPLASSSGSTHFPADSGTAESAQFADQPSTPLEFARRMASRCPRSEGGYCCLTFLPADKGGGSTSSETKHSVVISSDNGQQQRLLPVMALRHPVGGWTSSGSSKSGGKGEEVANQLLPYKLAAAQTSTQKDTKSSSSSSKPLKLGGVPETDLLYISTVRLFQNNTEAYPQSTNGASKMTKFPTHPADTPNFFDILFENDCLPYRKECHRCLKDVANEAPITVTSDDGEEGEEGSQEEQIQVLSTTNACSKCQLECPCYCDILCKVRPLPKPITRTYTVRPPQYRKEPHRLVPKIIHQTWFEPITKDKYPNMSRLIESWKKSGWEYYFYDDDVAGEFLGSHFPPEIREAYESITPGAFKADLFRYCVLLIRGGVYADMDVLLETNLDDAIANDIGFMTPIDEPGSEVGHRSCLWNGLIASAPGHPFLARTIEIVVNNIRNRFTAVDYDDMLCPNPILSVSHTVDTLFTCGPCILGAGINNLLGRHMQTEFAIGDVDVWQKERTAAENTASKGSSDGNNNNVAADDQRLLIPGRTVILEQNKNDMGAHRFTWADRHLIIASTDMPDYDDRPPSKEHYSKTHEKAGVYGMRKLYTDTKRANEEIRIFVEKF